MSKSTNWIAEADARLRNDFMVELYGVLLSKNRTHEQTQFLHDVIEAHYSSLNDEDRANDRPERFVEYLTPGGLRFVPRDVAAEHGRLTA